MADKNNLLLFFDRPAEPCFMQKGEEKAVFELPDNYFPEKYKVLSDTISNRFGNDAGRTIPVQNIALPNLSLPLQLPYNAQFSFFVPKHRDMAGKLIDIFMGMRDIQDLMSVASYCQLRVNPYMFNYCLSVAILHRPDTRGVGIPTFAELFPDKFVDPKVFRKAREASSVAPSGARMPVIIPVNYTAGPNEPEQRVAYFREDIGVNLHHWHWHLVYPNKASDNNVVNKDRRGELFYYMHQQIIARYTTERFCNGLGRVRRYNNLREPIEEAYFPKLDSQVASRAWSPRFSGTTVRDLVRPLEQIRLDVSQMETWIDRIIQAIEKRSALLPNGRQVPLDEERGIDILGNIIESSTISPNQEYYGDIHNMGHIFIAYAHDPDNRHLEAFGVMGDSATAMRDPVFYRWHSYIDDLFVSYKNQLPPYGIDKLNFPGIRVNGIHIEGSAGRNIFGTRWELSTVELTHGLDFTPRGSVTARFTHLQHEPFKYIIEYNNTTKKTAMGTVRIFLAPTQDEKGQPLEFNEQRRFLIELDKFTAQLKPGNNVINRQSSSSSVTIPYERTFRDQSSRVADPTSPEAAPFNFCGCGWPHHMLIPKGNLKGFPMVLFVMISNWAEDRIEQDLVGTCNDAASYCGIRDRKYPDRRAMGFPFDRPITANSLEEFLQPNMCIARCMVRHNDVTIPRGQNA
ncbi:unnamed protein product [Arctia plantaginis]|uniref:tyrosinase n=1 Tax=Arctia plantaginis TaxID=874455 RepID=A0A8S0YRY0_ARCPL|nr:unnamed protein product [Arctia plantaginis]